MLPQDLKPYGCCFLTGLVVGLILAQQDFNPSLLGWIFITGLVLGGIATALFFDLRNKGQEEELF